LLPFLKERSFFTYGAFQKSKLGGHTVHLENEIGVFKSFRLKTHQPFGII